MKKKILFFVLFLTTLSLSVGLVYAWSTPLINTIPLVGSADGVAISYNIDGGAENVSGFQISDIAFFDETSESEISYFDSMYKRITLNITNTSDGSVNVRIEQIVPEISEDFTLVSSKDSAYIRCLFSSDEISVTTQTKISDFYTDYSSATFYNLEAHASLSLYVYVIGIQCNPLADNLFLNETFTFQIRIFSENA